MVKWSKSGIHAGSDPEVHQEKILKGRLDKLNQACFLIFMGGVFALFMIQPFNEVRT